MLVLDGEKRKSKQGGRYTESEKKAVLQLETKGGDKETFLNFFFSTSEKNPEKKIEKKKTKSLQALSSAQTATSSPTRR